ncbi:YggS family pyridoxal phosphate-dependent enzyme [Aliicoccus persicus]|uniref:Pyridoxal phosphate homeostasis protein n=1 Tax=Aliicoccus persicus TaxID=930138 RepID=A0A662Z079_9STAP|nr:YggS family pyridoxal phosphate-dependent enzyme [Aliicoccus persicus]SEV80694.1 hypothetical protein SAMN05192557_0105 [Aliicoccus persicus]
MTIKENYEAILSEIPESTNVVVVTKYHTVEETLEAYEAGVRHFGENRVEGFLEKRAALPADAHVHFIGTLQSRKVKDISEHLEYLHSLERLSVAKKIENECAGPVKCFIQVNVSGEESKHGLHVDDVADFLESLKPYKKVQVVGLMTMAPHVDDEGEIESVFVKLKELSNRLALSNADNIQLKELSMGMSNDYHIAVRHGASFIRIGSKIMSKE